MVDALWPRLFCVFLVACFLAGIAFGVRLLCAGCVLCITYLKGNAFYGLGVLCLSGCLLHGWECFWCSLALCGAGEIYQVLLPLYGFRSSAAYWFRECRTFLESLGFVMDPLAVCHFRKFLNDDCTSFVQMVLVQFLSYQEESSGDQRHLYRYCDQSSPKS